MLWLNFSFKKYYFCFLRCFFESDNTNLFRVIAVEDLVSIFCAPLNMPSAPAFSMLVCKVVTIFHWASPLWWGSPLYQGVRSGEKYKNAIHPRLKRSVARARIIIIILGARWISGYFH